jgi:hypothetical protein
MHLHLRIGFIGQKGAGKDESYRILSDILETQNIKCRRFAFADAMKEVVSELFTIPLSVLHAPNLKDVPFATPVVNLQKAIAHPRWGHYFDYVRQHNADGPELVAKVRASIVNFVENIDPLDTRPRRYLQDFAETMRQQVDPRLWAILLEPQLLVCDDHQVSIITDVRHREEIEFALEGHKSLTVLIVRPTLSNDEHVSEQMAKNFTKADMVIYNDSDLVSLRNKLKELADFIVAQVKQHADAQCL